MEALVRRVYAWLRSYPAEHVGTLAFGGVAAVFGRHCPELAKKVALVSNQGGVTHLAISGNVGKDSGRLAEWGVPEAHYLLSAADIIEPSALFQTKVGIDLTAKNGVENAARMVEIFLDFGFRGRQPRQLVVVAHSTQMLRLGLTFNRALVNAGMGFDRVLWLPSDYKPSLGRLQDQWEICFELVRLADMQAADEISGPQVPADLAAQARAHLDNVTSELQSQGLPLSTAGLPSR